MIGLPSDKATAELLVLYRSIFGDDIGKNLVTRFYVSLCTVHH